MDWVELAVAQFCQDLRVSVPAPLARVVQLDFEDSGTLQLERHGEQLSLWLALTLPRQPALQAAACLLGERDEDERLLQMALNLLHKV
ncbi:TPA: hypothetical protein ACIXXC_001762 [Pseudomonas aeruginosa]